MGKLRAIGAVGPVFLSAALLLATVRPASAQLAVGGAIVEDTSGTTTRGVDGAFDPVNGVFLVVGAYGPVRGVFVNVAGQPVSGPFIISSGAGHANFARAAYSPQLGGFMVVWSSEEGTTLRVRSRGVAYPGALLGTEHIVSDDASPPWLEAAPALAYSATSQQFLAAWQGFPPSVTLKARLIGLDGSGVGAVVQLSSGYARDPGVAWNPNRNEFGVSFNGETVGGSYSALAIVPASNPAAFRRTTFNVLGGGILSYITDLAFSTATGRWVMAWYEAVKANVAQFDQDGNVLGSSIATTRVGVYDSLSLSYNPVSQTFMLDGLDPVTDNLNAVELNKSGVRFGNEVQLGAGSAYYARAASSSSSARWLGLYAKTFHATSVPAVTASANGGPTITQPSTQPPPSSTSTCPGGPIPGMTCVNGEWTFTGSSGGGGSTGGTGTSSCPGGSIPGMTCVNGEWVPSTSSGGSTGGTGTSSCPGGSIPGMTCINGEWVPSTSTGSSGGTGTSSCPGGSIPGMTCVNGEWVPSTSSGGSTGGTGTSSCPGFVPGMTCVNGNWVPGTSGGSTGGTGTSSCPGFVPGMTCVNGNWVPGTSSGSSGSTSSCPGFVPGMTCVNGEWVPGGTASSTGSGASCPGGPIPGMTCINGEWTPTGSAGGGGGSTLPVCTGGNMAAPMPTWVRIGATEWVPPDSPLAVNATCRAQ